MVISVTGSPYVDRFGETYYRYRSSNIGKNYASGSFRIQTKRGVVEFTEEQAREEAARQTANFLNIPIYDIQGYESRAPKPEAVGATTQERQQAAYESQQRLNALRAKREQLKQNFGGTPASEYNERMMRADLGTPTPTRSQYEVTKALGTGTTQFSSEQAVQEQFKKHEQFAEFAGIKEFRGQVAQRTQPQPPQAAPQSSYGESPFGKGIIKKENFPGATRYPNTPIIDDPITARLMGTKSTRIAGGAIKEISRIQGDIDRGTSKGSVFTQFNAGVVGGGLEVGKLGIKAGRFVGNWIEDREASSEMFKRQLPEAGAVALGVLPGLGKQFKDNPAKTSGEFIGMSLAFGAGAKGVRKGIKTAKAEIPKMAINTKALLKDTSASSDLLPGRKKFDSSVLKPFGNLGGGSLFKSPVKKGNGIGQRTGAFAEFRAAMEGTKPLEIEISKPKPKDSSVIDKRKIKTGLEKPAPKFNIPDSFFAEEPKLLGITKPKPKLKAQKDFGIEIRPKPKESGEFKEIKTGTGQVLLQKVIQKEKTIQKPKVVEELKGTTTLKGVTKTSTKGFIISVPKIKAETGLKTGMRSYLKMKPVQIVRPILKTDTKINTRMAIAPAIKPVTSQKPYLKVWQSPKLRTGLSPKLGTELAPKLRQMERTLEKSVQKYRMPEVPKIRIPSLGTGTKKGSKVPKSWKRNRTAWRIKNWTFGARS